MADFDWTQCEARIFVHEGGYTNNPRDPGGPTNYGVTIADARLYGKEFGWIEHPSANDVRNMPKVFAQKVLKAKYWDALNCGALPAGVDDTIFDYGVNSGIGRAGKVLRRVVGLPDNTWRATSDVVDAVNKRTPKDLITAINAERLQFLRGLDTFPEFGTGWTTRVKEVRSYSYQLSDAALGKAPLRPAVFTTPTESTPMAKGVVPGPDTSATLGIGATLTGVAGALAMRGGIDIAAVVASAAAILGLLFFMAYRAKKLHLNTITERQEASSGPITIAPARLRA